MESLKSRRTWGFSGVRVGGMNFHLDCSFCCGLVAGVTVESILCHLWTCWGETAQVVNKYWNSFYADHSLFFWDKNHARILETKSNLSASMAHIKGPVPLPTAARLCSWTGALSGCEQPPNGMTMGMKASNISGCHMPCCTLAAARNSGWRSISGGALWAEESILRQGHHYLFLGTTERGNGAWYLLPLPSAPPEGTSRQPLTPAPGSQSEGTPLPTDLGGDSLLLASSQNSTVWKSDEKNLFQMVIQYLNPGISALAALLRRRGAAGQSGSLWAGAGLGSTPGLAKKDGWVFQGG